MKGTATHAARGPTRRIWAGHLVQNAVALMVSSGGTAVLGIAFWTTAAHLATVQNVGRTSAEIAAMTLLANLAQLSFGSIFDRFLPVAGNQTRAFVTRAYLICTSVALLAADVYLLAGFGRRIIPSGPGWQALFVGAVALWTIFILQDSVLTGLRATRWVPVENILFALAKLALLPLALLVTVRQGLFLAWSVPVVGATVAVSWYLFRKRIPEHELLNPSTEHLPSVREILFLAIAQYAQSLILVFTPPIVVLIVIQRLGVVDEARYYLPALISNGALLFLWNLSTSFLVEASRDPSALRQHANTTIKASIVLLVPTVAIGVGFAPEILRIFGEDYALHGTTLLRMLLLSLPGTAVASFYSAFAWLDRRVWRLAIRDLVSAVAYFAILLALIGHFGILAIGIASLITSGIQGVIFLPIAIKRYRGTAPVARSQAAIASAPTPDDDAPAPKSP
jgi:O-antigen/teichoic acid export membrane protein